MRALMAWACVAVLGCGSVSPSSDAGDGGSVGDGGTPLVPAGVQSLFASASLGGFQTSCREADGGFFGPSTWNLSLDSGVMTWRVCHSDLVSGHTQIDAGTSLLTLGEVAGVEQKLNAMSRSSRTECGADGVTLKLRLTTATQTIGYIDSFYACVAQQEVVVDGMEPVITELGRLTR